MKSPLLPVLCALLANSVMARAVTLEIREGDHICLIGNTLAERMQFEGHNHWETLLHQRFPKHHLVVRNLAWPADEVVLRPRAEGFGTPDEHLTFCKADVIIAFFGFNESFKGAERGLQSAHSDDHGLQSALLSFQGDLEEWIKHTKSQSYNGKSEPRIALVSPIAAEQQSGRGFQPRSQDGKGLEAPSTFDAAAMNTRLALYTKAMKEVAEKNGVVFADVFDPSQKFYEKDHHHPCEAATINGVHLNAVGDSSFGAALDKALFRNQEGSLLYQEQVRREIEAKSLLWYQRHRIIDSYYVYGGRSGLKFADGDQTNRDVMQREREVLDQMCANRDKRIWKLAQGEKIPEKCDDSNVPKFLDVQTSFGVNRRKEAGTNTGQTSKTAEGASAEISPSSVTLKKFKLATGYAINLFASSEQFPELGNAVSLTFDTRGRMLCTTMPSYPQWRPGDVLDDKVVILEDADHDGKADYCNTFAGGMQCPISLEMANGGVLVGQQRELLFFKDTNGDDKADTKEVILSGFDSADSHHAHNAFTYGPGGDLYFQEGTFHHTQVETPYGPVRCKNAGTYRFEPRTGELDVFVSYSYANPHGIAFDEWGQTFIADASGGANYFATAFSGWLPYPEKHATMQQFIVKRVRPTSGCEFVSSRNFPEDAQGDFLLNNCIGVQGVLRHKVKAAGSGYEGREVEPLVLCDDVNFRPVALRFGPDGALYIVDWQDALVGHMQYSLRDPLRDHKQARIWRVAFKGRPLVKPAQIAGEKIEKLLELLNEPEHRTRERVKLELSTRDTREVMAALEKWVVDQNPNPAIGGLHSVREHKLLEALWVCQWHNVANLDLLHRLLASDTPQARAAAVRVLCYWRDRVPGALDLLEKAANDEHPLVRLEAVRACSFFGDPLRSKPGQAATAANIALKALNHEMDYYLTYTLGETMRSLKPSPKDINVTDNPKALAYVLEKMTNDELKTAPKVEAVLKAQLERRGLDATTRDAAATELAKLNKTTREQELIAAIIRLDAQEVDTPASADLGKLLAASPREALGKAQEGITRMANKDHCVHSARVAAMAAYMAWTADPGKLWTARQDNQETLAVLLESIVLIPDPTLRAKFQPLLADSLVTRPQPDRVRKAALAALPLTGYHHATANFAVIADHIARGQMRDIAAQAAMQLPRAAWDRSRAQALVESILAYAKTVPASQRARQDYVEVAQFGMELCSLLPMETGGKLRKSLRGLGVSVFVIKTVREQMRYDTPQIVVEAGEPFEVIFENNDIMPHNMVFIRPGTRTEIGTLAQTMPMVPDARGFLFVPQHKGILPGAFTKMLEPGEKARLQLTAPRGPGDYEYVCTFPGHWMIMFGKMIVVKDVDAYLQKLSTAAK